MENGTPLRDAAEAQERSKQLVQHSRDELRVGQSSWPGRGLLTGLLVEKGIVEHATHSDLELTSDCALKLGLCRTEDLQQAKQYFLSTAEMGSLQGGADGCFEQLDLELDDFGKRGLGPQPLIPSHIVGMASYVNEFSERLEARPDERSFDWEKFRSCIREIHEFHQRNLPRQPMARDDPKMKDYLAQIKQDMDTTVESLNYLTRQSQKLLSRIEGIESRISQLDLRVEQFDERFNANVFKRKKSLEDMRALSSRREGIGMKLASIGAEIHESKNLLLQGQSLEK